MTTNTYLGSGTYVTARKQGIISYCDVAINNTNSPYTALAYDHIIRADATSGAITINLPTAVGIAGKEYHIFRTDILGSTNIITIDANSTETIDSNLTYLLYPGEWLRLESDGANWQVIARAPSGWEYYVLKGATANRRIIGGISLTSAFMGTVASTTTPALNTLWALPLAVPKTTKFDLISFRITTLAGAGGVARAGIYRDNGNMYPGSLIFDTGSIATDAATGMKNTTITTAVQIFQPGLYWLAWECGVAAPQLRVLQTINAGILGFDSDYGSVTNPGWGYTVAHTFGALPDPYTAGGTLLAAGGAPAAGVPTPAVGLHPA